MHAVTSAAATASNRLTAMTTAARRYLPFRKEDEDETLHFAHHEERTEMTVFENGTDGATTKDENSAEKGLEMNGALPHKGWVTKTEGSNEPIAHRNITSWDAGWNVTNAIQGMFIVAFPYSVLHGGYWAIVVIVGIAYICCWTGKILVYCLYEEDKQTGEKIRVRKTYVEIAEEVWGKRRGAQVVYAAQFVELIMTCILYLVLCGDLLSNSFKYSGISASTWTIISSAFLVPCAFLRNLKSVSRLSFGCTVAHIFINIIIIGYCVTQIPHWQWGEVRLLVDIHYFPIVLGIVVFSYTSQIFLPSLEGNMEDKHNFNKMMHWTHGLAGLFKALFGYVGFLTWGWATKEVITDNLPSDVFRAIVNIFLVVKALLSYPLPYFASVELIERHFFQGRPATFFPTCYALDGGLTVWGVFLRCVLVVFTLLLAIYVPHFALLMGLIGSFTGTMLSFIWPCWFHLKLKWHSIPWYQKMFDFIIILTGLVCGTIGIIYASQALVEAYQTNITTGF
ncbi:vesicular inhibitory amino acid transporter-like [Saccoglossus kowalevskii]|uniref:Vesicular inhibitory amino acid transporter-like n=1 Tax=Saccoglossus kowalevskii TaxID=10224 RepID=A0ABM0M4R7_SACKO|nr:PREDICTED: vesicular inhibitory amino acid transporter-like [Saccoglossus kowalevskii]